jgi:flavin-dependent dehydrogenase
VFRDSAEESESDWTIEASGRTAAEGACGGERVGCFARIVDMPFESTTSIAATQDGWIFTAPHPDGGLAALLVAPSPLRAAATAEDVALRLERAGRKVAAATVCDISRPEPIAPRLAASLCGAGRLVVGESALALDPLRGDGSGFALRGALLAQAVLAAIEDGHGTAQYLAHYEKRLRSTFGGHLRGCSAHYRVARHSEIWARDIAAMDRAAAAADVGEEPFEFRLAGFSLVPMQTLRGVPSEPRAKPEARPS